MRPPDNGVICWEQSVRRLWPSSHWLLVLRQLEMIQESAERIGLYAQFLWNLKLQVVWIIENNSRTTAAKPNITKYSLKLSNWGFPSAFLDSYTAWEGRAVWIQVTGLLVFIWALRRDVGYFREIRSLSLGHSPSRYPSPNRKIREIQYPAPHSYLYEERSLALTDRELRAKFSLPTMKFGSQNIRSSSS